MASDCDGLAGTCFGAIYRKGYLRLRHGHDRPDAAPGRGDHADLRVVRRRESRRGGPSRNGLERRRRAGNGKQYTDVSESYTDHSLFLTKRSRYANLFKLDILDYPAWARTLKQDGYATNPQYADRLISLIERFNIARLDTLCLRQQGIEVPVAPVAQYIPRQQLEKAFDNNQQNPAKPEKPKTPASTDKPATGQMKVFTAIGSDYPAGNSPFSYRKVFENNHTFFIIAQSGDTYEKIAGDVQVSSENLRKFNDVLDNGQPVENEIVYIEAKGKTCNTRIHIVQTGETLRYIAQRYGVQLRYLFKYNMMDENTIIHPGDQILLRH